MKSSKRSVEKLFQCFNYTKLPIQGVKQPLYTRYCVK